MKRVVDEQGLTLIEAAVVLAIVSMLFLLPMITFQSYEEKIEVDLFIEEVRNNVTLMQNHAVFNGQATEIQVRAENNTIDFFCARTAESFVKSDNHSSREHHRIDLEPLPIPCLFREYWPAWSCTISGARWSI